jgi:hypothetical protein
VEDSFCALALGSHGFRILFAAEWICRAASRPPADGGVSGVRWVELRTASDLAAWESAWSGQALADSHADSARMFPPSWLADRDVAVIAACRAEQIVAGTIANRTGDVVGMSNVFLPPSEGERLLAGCVGAVMNAFPGLPIVGYEGGRRLGAMRDVGFDALGPLRIWVKH